MKTRVKIPGEQNGVLEFGGAVRTAIRILIEANQMAEHFGMNSWEFAVGIHSLRGAGVTETTLRCLILKGYVLHAIELAKPRSQKRTFCRVRNLGFNEQSCFVLTEAGISLAPAVRDESQRVPKTENNTARRNGISSVTKPRWDANCRELHLGTVLVKRFMVPATNQETILGAFEEEGWSPRIDDPLPPHGEQNRVRRLHESLSRLNRNQMHTLIHFRGDGTGCSICWELVLSSAM